MSFDKSVSMDRTGTKNILKIVSSLFIIDMRYYYRSLQKYDEMNNFIWLLDFMRSFNCIFPSWHVSKQTCSWSPRPLIV